MGFLDAFAVVFINFNGDVRFISLKIRIAPGISYPIIENLNQPQ